MQRKTKIVCTVGPASSDPEMLRRLIMAGMDVARLNFSHGTHDEHLEVIQQLRRLSGELEKPVAILQDLGGPKIRVGEITRESVDLRPGDSFVITTSVVPGNWERVSVNYPDLPAEVEVGDVVLLAEGSIELQITAIRGNEIETRVIVGGPLSSHKGVNLPSRSLKIPALTEKDEADLEFGLRHGVDWTALSFVRRPEDLRRVKQIMTKFKKTVPLIAKIEKHEAIENIDAIIEEVDGVMIARGDLGLETPLERVPLLQKMLIGKMNTTGKPVITATQMLRSMVENPRPTRAETADVANAILDGTDAIMLSEETASGQYPLAAVRVMARIAEETEKQLPYEELLTRKQSHREGSVTDGIGHAACIMASDLEAAAIIAATQSGSTARLISRFRPRAPVFAMTPQETTYRCLNLSWGVVPVKIEPLQDSEDLFAQVREFALRRRMARPGQVVIVTAGVPLGGAGTTNMIKAMVI
jgi:pyruvate kinase